MNYYNEWDKGAAAWLRELIKAGLIPNGYVDDRSITEVTPSDLEGFTQCHFFAGIGGWSYALQLAGIPANTRLWTGSPPCQPFSVAGKQLGQLDERHLAPTFMRLVAQCRPPLLFGEQVAAAINKRDDKGLYGMQPDQILDGISEILGAVTGWAPSIMHRMPAGLRKRLAQGALRGNQETASAEQTGSESLFCAVPYREQGQILDCRMPSQVCEERDTLRPGSVRNAASRKDDERIMRAEQNPARSNIIKADSLHAVAGQDRSGRAVHDRQCADSLLGHKRIVRGLGGADSLETLLRLIDEAGAPNSEREIASIIGRAIEVSTGSGWLDDLFTELEEQGYTCGAAVLPAASVGAPHKRDRLFFGAVGNAAHIRINRSRYPRPSGRDEYPDNGSAGSMADSDHDRQQSGGRRRRGGEPSGTRHDTGRHGESCSVADTYDTRPQGRIGVPERTDKQFAGEDGLAGGLAYTDGEGRRDGRQRERGMDECDRREETERGGSGGSAERLCTPDATDPHHGFWSDADWISCRDGKYRAVEPGTSPLASGISARVGRLRGYGNAIVPQVAAEFIKAFTGAVTDAGN